MELRTYLSFPREVVASIVFRTARRAALNNQELVTTIELLSPYRTILHT